MSYAIQRVAVIGSGTMGGGIAGVLANAGIPVDLLDIAPPALTPEEVRLGFALNSPAVRNRIVSASFERLKLSTPPAFASPESANLITIGNLEDNFDRIAEADWIIEVIIENLPAKRQLLARIEKVRRASSIVSSNTSGLPISAIAAGCGADLQAHFLGTHFFTPPRYMKLLEVIPTTATRPGITSFMTEFAEQRLAKGVVICKDTPNFIANRLVAMLVSTAMGFVLDHEYTIEEADAILGPLIGRPPTALFRMCDLVGLDVAAAVGANLYELIEHDESRSALRQANYLNLCASQIERGRLGDKTRQGFYKKGLPGVKPGAKIDKRDILTLDLETMEYRERREPDIPSLPQALSIAQLAERLRFVLAQDDKAGALARHTVYHSLAYAARRIPEITDRLIDVDNTMRWGYAHELGPFELWDALGLRRTVTAMRAHNLTIAPWVEELLEAGKETFYVSSNGRLSYYNPAGKNYVAVGG